MPFLTIHTNGKVQDSKAFLAETADFVAAELHKPISYVIVTLDSNQDMLFGGNENIKSALGEMISIGFGNKAALAAKLTDFLEAKLALDKRHIDIHFIDMPAADLSIGGSLLD